MRHLNDVNGAGSRTLEVAGRIMAEFNGPIVGAEFGIAYGGGIERIGLLWGQRGTVYGFDTFEGHPKQLYEVCEKTQEAGADSIAVTCMDGWYEKYGKEEYSESYIRRCLDNQGLTNVHLVKGLVDETTSIDHLPDFHYCLLDFDFPIAMQNAYKLVKDKIVKGGYLCLHDVIPKGHINGLYEIYQQALKDFKLVEECPAGTHLVILKR